MSRDTAESADPLALTDVAVVVEAAGTTASIAAYTALLGDPDPDPESGAPEGGRWPVANGSIAVVPEPDCAGAWAAFQAANVDAAATLLGRRGAPLDERVVHAGARRLANAPALGVTGDAGARPGPARLDHVVFTVPSVDAGVALFAGRLGMNLRLVREFGDLAQLFFRTGTVVVEVLAGGDSPPPGVALWGLAWRSDDLDADHTRLTAAGLAVSEVRTGRKPGTRVMTVREPALGTPTILLEQRDT